MAALILLVSGFQLYVPFLVSEDITDAHTLARSPPPWCSLCTTRGQHLPTQVVCSLLLKHLLEVCPDLSLAQGPELLPVLQCASKPGIIKVSRFFYFKI